MKYLKLVIVFCFTAVVLTHCAGGPSGADYRNEVGANGLPTPRALLARYVDAIGGEDVIRSHSSTTMRGRFVLGGFGIEGDMVIYSAAPNYISQLIELSGLGTIESGYNGEVGWSVNPLQGNSVLEGDALIDIVQQADYYLPLNYATIFPQQETQEVTQVKGSDAYKVSMVDSRGKTTTLYFSVESALIVRTDATAASPLGDIETSTLINAYGDYAGYRLPSSLTINQAGQEFDILISEVTFDDVTDDRFVPPAAIQSLLR